MRYRLKLLPLHRSILPVRRLPNGTGREIGVIMAGIMARQFIGTGSQRRGGHAKAQYHLGQMHSKGEGISKDTELAIYWWRQACDNGSSDACSNLE